MYSQEKKATAGRWSHWRDLSCREGAAAGCHGKMACSPEQISRMKGSALRMMKLREATLARVFEQEGVDHSELQRFLQFCKPRPEESREVTLFLGTALRLLTGPVALSPEQTARLESSLVHRLEPQILEDVREYKAKALAAEALGKTLDEPAEPKPPERAEKDDDTCIMCMEEPRSTLYRPCRHRVCCQPCAEAYWHRSRLCPWCSREVDEV